MSDFENEQTDYQNFLDIECLDEFEEDAGAFKKEMTKRCPIIRRCLNSPKREMKKYKNAFRLKTGRELLDVTKNIIHFCNSYVETFDDNTHEKTENVEDLNLSELLEDQYISYEVIGGGIKSHFLYSLYPNIYANRSQSAIWSIWYLTDKKDFGFKDGSEFLMIDLQNGKIQQNYHYPYDLFCFYCLKIYQLLKNECNKHGLIFENKYRYIYLDTFFNFISDYNQKEIDDLKKDGEYEE